MRIIMPNKNQTLSAMIPLINHVNNYNYYQIPWLMWGLYANKTDITKLSGSLIINENTYAENKCQKLSAMIPLINHVKNYNYYQNPWLMWGRTHDIRVISTTL